MNMKRTALFSMLALLLCVGLIDSVARAGVDRIYNYNDGSGWLTQTIRTDDVAAIANDWDPCSLNMVYCATEPNGFDRNYKMAFNWITNLLTWQPPGYPVNNNTSNYTTLARCIKGFTFAAKANGGVDRIFYWSEDSCWYRASIPAAEGKTYSVLADMGRANNPLQMFYGVANGVGLQRIFYWSPDTAWYAETMSTVQYVDIVANEAAASVSQVFGVRPDGGLDRVVFVNDEGMPWWTQEMMPASDYVAVADRSKIVNECYAARVDGLDCIYWDGAAWTKQVLNTNEYVDIIADPCSSNILFGARRAGGIDCIYSNDDGTTWITETISTGKKYTSIICQRNNQTTITYDVWTWPGGDISVYGLYPKCDTLSGDINHDCHVDFGDIQLFSTEWLQNAL